MRQNFKNPIEYEGSRVKIMRQLPKQILTEKKAFKKLTDKLRGKNIGFRWELPKGLSFVHGGSRKMIMTVDKMEEFLLENAKDFEI